MQNNQLLFNHDRLVYEERLVNLIKEKRLKMKELDTNIAINKHQQKQILLEPDSDFLKSDSDTEYNSADEADNLERDEDIQLLQQVTNRAIEEEFFMDQQYQIIDSKIDIAPQLQPQEDRYDDNLQDIPRVINEDSNSTQCANTPINAKRKFSKVQFMNDEETQYIADLDLTSQTNTLSKTQQRKIRKNLKLSIFTNNQCEAIDCTLYINCHQKDTTRHLIKSQQVLRDYISGINILLFKRTEKLKEDRKQRIFLQNQLKELKALQPSTENLCQQKLNRARCKQVKKDSYTKKPSILNSILIFICLFNIFFQTNAFFPCPNRGRQIEYLDDYDNKNGMQKRYSKCQSPLEINEAMEIISYLDIKRPCIWPVNNFTDFIIDTTKSQWRIYQYGNVLIDQGNLQYDAYRIAGVYASNQDIYIQFAESNYTSIYRNQSRAKNIDLLETILSLATSKTFFNTINNQYKIHSILLNITSPFFRFSNSLKKYVIDDGFQDCYKIQGDNFTQFQINYTGISINEMVMPIYQNLSDILIIKKFLTVNNFQLTQKPQTSQRRMLAGAQQSAFNGLNLKVTDNMLQGCSMISSGAGGAMEKSCLYRVIIEEKGVGHLVFQDPNFGLAAVQYPVEVYNLRSTNSDCYDTIAEFEYRCKCCTKTAFCGSPGTNWQKFIFGPNDYKNLFSGNVDDAIKRGALTLSTESKIYNQGGEGCSTAWDAQAQIITKQRLTGGRSRVYSINLEDTCVYVTPVFIRPESSKVMASTGIHYCHTQEKYNSIRGDYNITIFSLQNNQPRITEDYVKIYQNNSFGSFQSSQYVVDGQFTNAICKAKIDKDLNIVLPEVKYQFDEISCNDDIMSHKILDDYIIKEQNVSNLTYFTRFTPIIPFKWLNHYFAPIQYTQKQIVGLGDPGNNHITIQVGNKLCSPQLAYAPDRKRVVMLLYCNYVGKIVDELMIIDNNNNVFNQKIILLTIDGKVVCHDPNNPDGLCEDIRFKEHAMRYIDFTQVDAEVQIKGLWMGMPDTEIRAKDCKITSPPLYREGAFREGRICCANDGIMKIIVDNGVDQFVQNLNTQNKCWDFNTNNVYIKKTNTEKYVIKIPNSQGLSNTNVDVVNSDFKQQSFTTTDGYNIKNYDPKPPSRIETLLQIIFYWSIVSLIWFVINAMIYAYEVHSKSIADGKPGFLYLICGGGIISALMACIANNKLLKWKKSTNQKLSVEDDLFKLYKDKLLKKAKKQVQDQENLIHRGEDSSKSKKN